MKALILVVTLTLTFSIHAQTSFAGKLKSGKGYCSIEIEEQGGNFKTVIYKNQKAELRFYNETLNNDSIESVSGLFKKSGNNYEAIIGSPIFALGRYYDFKITNNQNKVFDINQKVYTAAIIGWVKIGSSQDQCVID